MADHVRGRPRRARLSRSRHTDAARPSAVVRVALLLVTIALTAAIAAATVSDIAHHGVSWLDIAALLVVVLFATGICGSLWEATRRRRRG